MNVGINGRVFSVDQPSGAGQAGINLIQALGKQNISLTVYGHKKATSRLNGISIEDPYFPINSQLYGLFWEQMILPAVAQRQCTDVLFCPTMNAPVRETDTPVVVQIHDIFRYIGDVSRLDKFRQRIRLPRMLSHADAVVTVSEFSKSEIIKHLGVSPSKVDVIYNGIDPVFLDDSEAEPIELPDEYLLYVGGTNARKNISSLLRCFEMLKSEYGVNHDLVMVGPDPKLHHSYPVSEVSGEDIHVTGYISKRELKFVYEHANVFLFPSLYEGFGMAPLEAMACDTPVVSSDRASLPEVLGEAAQLVDPTDMPEFSKSVYRVLSNKDLRAKLVRLGHSRSKKFSWDKSADQLHDIFQSLSKDS